MKTAIYLRVSTEEQAREGYSISGHMKKLKAFCISQSWDVAGIYADEGISAKDMNRPELKRMIKDIKNNKIDCVLVYRLDRLTRSVFDLYKLLETFEKHDCKFKSATEVYDTTTAMGRMFITIVAALAQWERENMGERISFGYEEKVRQGKCPLNSAPIGYDLDKEESKLYINEKEAIVVRALFDKYIEGLGSNRLIRYLNDNNLLTKQGRKWSSATLFQVIRSPVPAGGIVWKRKTYWDMHEPIITRDRWDEAQRLRKARREVSPRSVSSPHIFTRMIPCPRCNQNLVGTNSTSHYKGNKTTYYYYRCSNKKIGTCDYKHSIGQKKLEEEFLNYLSKLDFNDLVPEVAKEGSVIEDSSNVDVEKLKEELAKIENLKKKWQYAWAEDIIPHDDFKKRMKEANLDEDRIKNHLIKFEKVEDEQPVKIEEVELALMDIKSNWDQLKSLEKKNLLNDIIKSIHIRRDGLKLTITDIEFL